MIFSMSGGTRKFRSWAPTEVGFTMTATPRQVVISSSSNSVTQVRDADIQTDVSATVDNEYDIGIDETVPNSIAYAEFTNLTPDIVTLTGGKLTRLADGTASILYGSPKLRKRLDLAISRTGGGTVTSFIGYVAGWLAKSMTDAVDLKLAGVAPANVTSSMSLFSTADHANGNYVWNPNRWCLGLDYTCRAVWNSWAWANVVAGSPGALAPQMAGTMVTPQHVLFSAHYNPLGTMNPLTIRFVDHNNVCYTRRILGGARMGDPFSQGFNYDVALGVLDTPLPASIKPAKMMPTNGFVRQLPSFSYSGPNPIAGWTNVPSVRFVPVVKHNQFLQASVGDWGYHDCTNFSNTFFSYPSSTLRAAFYLNIINGDSSSPAFVHPNGDTVLVTTWSTGGNGAGPNYSSNDQKAWINSTIPAIDASAGLNTGYQVQTYNLSGWPTF